MLSFPKSYGGFKSLLASWSGEETLSAPLRLLAGAGAGIVAVCEQFTISRCSGMTGVDGEKPRRTLWILFEPVYQ